MKKFLIVLIVFVILIVGGWYVYTKVLHNTLPTLPSFTKTADSPSIVATVNGTNLTESELKKTQDQIVTAQNIDVTTLTKDQTTALHKAALDALIGKTLLNQAVAKADTAPTTDELDAEIAKIRARFKSDDEFTKALTQQGLTTESLRTQTANDMASQKYFSVTFAGKIVAPTEKEIQDAYDTSTKSIKNPPKFTDVHDQIKQALVTQKQQALLTELVKNLRAKATIVIK